jgi:hypothetical protein
MRQDKKKRTVDALDGRQHQRRAADVTVTRRTASELEVFEIVGAVDRLIETVIGRNGTSPDRQAGHQHGGPQT